MKKIIGMLTFLSISMIACDADKSKSDAYGNFEAVDLLVAAESQGRLIEFRIEEGQELRTGYQAGLIDTIQLSLKIDQLQAAKKTVFSKINTLETQIEAVNIQKTNLLREYDRISSLMDDGAATGKQMDDLKGQIKLLDAQIKTLGSQIQSVSTEQTSLDIQIEQVRDQVRRSRIMNPIDGTVLQKYKEEGELVIPGQNLYKISDLDTLILRAYISGNQLSEVAVGEEVQVFIDTLNGLRTFKGTVTWIASQSEFTPKIIQTRDERVSLVYAMKIKVPNDGSLKIGMPAEVKFK
ncbi:MAG: HlyD family efflux transporter periplasmic adaptor subunit [Bacteroidales bacterium]|nr:HlyD family efflux transporter periplasmic adaptor subunit [Bacteroidales bacterium]